MPRLTNPTTGSVVNVSDATAERLLAAGYKASDKPAKKTAAKKSDDTESE